MRIVYVPRELLTHQNPKTLKGENHGYLTGILHFAPHMAAGVGNVCAYASPECIKACLNTSGHGTYANVQEARVRRTRYFNADRVGFMAMLCGEIEKLERKAAKRGLKPAVRLNGTSDLPWENVRCEGYKNVMTAFPEVRFYDYSKLPVRLRRRTFDIPNYSLTFSYSGQNEQHCREALDAGLNVAVVFEPGYLPETWWDRPVFDGDVSDLRFLDPEGVIVGLKAKGTQWKKSVGFVQMKGKA